MSEAAAAIAVLRAAYPRQSFPDESVAFYARKLADLPGPELVAAVDRITNRSSFLPSVAEIRLEVAEAVLGLPDVTEAWEIALSGSLRDAPACVRAATEFVGGRYALLRTNRPEVVRAQFREQYTRLRERALLEEAGAVADRALPGSDRPALPPSPSNGNGELERLPMPAVLLRQLAYERGDELGPPSEAEMRDAISILRVGPWSGDPTDDMLYMAAERVLHEADEAERC